MIILRSALTVSYTHLYTMFLGESMVEYKIIIPQVGK